MPVEDLGEGFSPDFGRHTKEHYSMCGLILLKEYFGWTDEETVDQYLYSFKIQYALKIQPDCLDMSSRTLTRYLKLFREKELAARLMEDVTSVIVRELNIEVDRSLMDSGYGSDENVMHASDRGVELVAPTTGKDPEKLGPEECEFDENNRLTKCPRGRKPLKCTFKDGKGRAVFSCNTCGKCPEYGRCCSSKIGNNYVISYDARSLRLRARRLYEQTDEFYEKHRILGGIEALFGNLKQYTPLRRLAVRGKSAVYNAIYSIMTVHNIMQMAKYHQKVMIRERLQAFWGEYFTYCFLNLHYSPHFEQ